MSTLSDAIKSGMEKVRRCFDFENGVLVNTDCMYPSNGVVQVTVMGAGSSYFVTDRGGAVRVAESAGANISNPARLGSKVLKKQGLHFSNGAIISPQVTLENIPAAILLVANASKELADSIFESYRIARDRNFKEIVKKLLTKEFADSEVKEGTIVGSSNKPHSFDNVIIFLDGSRLLVDPVLRDANSINSRLVANMDVHSAAHPKLIQRIVYDDEDDWQSADLGLLGIGGVPVIPFSKSERALKLAIGLH